MDIKSWLLTFTVLVVQSKITSNFNVSEYRQFWFIPLCWPVMKPPFDINLAKPFSDINLPERKFLLSHFFFCRREARLHPLRKYPLPFDLRRKLLIPEVDNFHFLSAPANLHTWIFPPEEQRLASAHLRLSHLFLKWQSWVFF